MEHPIATSGSLSERTGITPATVNKALGHLERLGIVKELTAQQRNRIFSYASYIEIMGRGTELPDESQIIRFKFSPQSFSIPPSGGGWGQAHGDFVMTRYAGFFKGVNVGGHRTIAMAELKRTLRDVGFFDADTLLQSGNIVFTAPAFEPQAIAQRIESACEATFGFHADVLVWRLADLRRAVNANPFEAEAVEAPSKLAFFFLSAAPAPKALQAFQAYDGPERIAAAGQVLYVYYPDGMGRSKLPEPGKALGVVATARNFNTVQKVLARLDALPS